MLRISKKELKEFFQFYALQVQLIDGDELIGENYLTMKHLIPMVEQKEDEFFNDFDFSREPYALLNEKQEKIGVFEISVLVY